MTDSNRNNTEQSASWRSLLRVVPFIRPYRHWLGFSVLTGVCEAGLSITITYLIKHLLDNALDLQLDPFMDFAWMMAGVIVCEIIVKLVGRYARERCALYAVRDLRNHTVHRWIS